MPRVKNPRTGETLPHGVAWGLFDKDGVKDEVRTLNLLTPKVVLNANEEVKTGRSISLK